MGVNAIEEKLKTMKIATTASFIDNSFHECLRDRHSNTVKTRLNKLTVNRAKGMPADQGKKKGPGKGPSDLSYIYRKREIRFVSPGGAHSFS